MNTKNESTEFFAEKTGDKILIEISITGNPDDVVKKIMDSIRRDTDLFDGAKCEQMFFKGVSIDDVTEKMKINTLIAIQETIKGYIDTPIKIFN